MSNEQGRMPPVTLPTIEPSPEAEEWMAEWRRRLDLPLRDLALAIGESASRSAANVLDDDDAAALRRLAGSPSAQAVLARELRGRLDHDKAIRERDEARRDLVSHWLEISTVATSWENIARANGWGYLCREEGE